MVLLTSKDLENIKYILLKTINTVERITKKKIVDFLEFI